MASRSVEDGWKRHIDDSIQLANRFPDRSIVHVDLGSGGGLPAIPIALHRRAAGFGDSLIMIEADMRKAAFLRTISRALGLAAEVVVGRAELASPWRGDVVTARALAPLDRLLDYVVCHMVPGGRAVLPKGRRVEEEIAAARRRWTFDLERTPSLTAPDATILTVSDIVRRPA